LNGDALVTSLRLIERVEVGSEPVYFVHVAGTPCPDCYYRRQLAEAKLLVLHEPTTGLSPGAINVARPETPMPAANLDKQSPAQISQWTDLTSAFFVFRARNLLVGSRVCTDGVGLNRLRFSHSSQSWVVGEQQ
jgi:hypothetical protein